MKDITETVCQRNSSEAAQQNFVKLCSYEGINVYPMFVLRKHKTNKIFNG